MLLAILACIGGIVVENLRWPEDRSELRTRFLEAEEFRERAGILVGLVLGHSVVRWLIALAAAILAVRALVALPDVHARLKGAITAGQITVLGLDALLGTAISLVMVVLALLARWIASGPRRPDTERG